MSKTELSTWRVSAYRHAQPISGRPLSDSIADSIGLSVGRMQAILELLDYHMATTRENGQPVGDGIDRTAIETALASVHLELQDVQALIAQWSEAERGPVVAAAKKKGAAAA